MPTTTTRTDLSDDLGVPGKPGIPDFIPDREDIIRAKGLIPRIPAADTRRPVTQSSTPVVEPSGIRSGYVLTYLLELHTPSERLTQKKLVPPFFTVTIVDSIAQPDNPEDFILVRNHVVQYVDYDTNGDFPTVTYGNVEQAIVATLKDALVQGKQVSVLWQREGSIMELMAPDPNARKILKAAQLFR